LARDSAPKVRRVRNKEDRKRPSVFIRLKTDEQFRANALFEPDPELADNGGFFEYFSHWDQQGNTYVPCAGEKCPFCLANDNPATQALTLWYFPDNDAADRLKVFTMNVSTVRDITDIAEEDGGLMGKKFRIKRLSDKGEYRIRSLSDKPLSKTEIKKLLKTAPNLEEMIEKQLRAQWERLKAMEALADDDDDDDDDEDEDETTAKKGKEKSEKNSKSKDEDEDEDDDEDEEDDEDDEEEDDDENDDEDEDDEDDEEDEDDDEDDSDDDDEDEDDDSDDEDDDESEELKDAKLEVVKADEKNEILSVKDEDGNKFDIWPAEGVEIDYDDVKKGATITVDAVKDDEGDYVATKITVAKVKGGAKKTTAKKDDKKKGGSKKK
jgi:hypothetical protein